MEKYVFGSSLYETSATTLGPLYCDHLNSLTIHYDKVCMHTTCAIVNQLVTYVVNMLNVILREVTIKRLE